MEVPIVYRKCLFGESKLNLGTVTGSLWLPWRLVLRPARAVPLRRAAAARVDRPQLS